MLGRYAMIWRIRVPARRRPARTCPHRPEAQDVALSRPKHGFESRWGRQPSLVPMKAAPPKRNMFGRRKGGLSAPRVSPEMGRKRGAIRRGLLDRLPGALDRPD